MCHSRHARAARPSDGRNPDHAPKKLAEKHSAECWDGHDEARFHWRVWQVDCPPKLATRDARVMSAGFNSIPLLTLSSRVNLWCQTLP